MADSDEVYYCGHCRRQQDPKEGERCKICGKITVSWFLRRESEETAYERWKYING
jgi:rRNA maturation endonuclease Nob1